MANKHTITTRDKWFLDKQMKDPVTQELFKVGDTIVICARCKTAHDISTWSMNSNKCCSMGCNHNTQLSFYKFSPIIFQPKKIHSSDFNIIAEKLSFREWIKLFNGYPIAKAVTVLLPIFFVVLFYFTDYWAISMIQVDNQLTVIQDQLIDLGRNSSDKLKYVIDKPQNLEIDIGNSDFKFDELNLSFDSVIPKLNIAVPSFQDIEPKIEQIKLVDKLTKTYIKVNSAFENAVERILVFLQDISTYVQNHFDS